jgi:hypothetical protein
LKSAYDEFSRAESGELRTEDDERFQVSAPPPAKKTAGLIEKETNSSPRSSQPPAHRAYAPVGAR